MHLLATSSFLSTLHLVIVPGHPGIVSGFDTGTGVSALKNTLLVCKTCAEAMPTLEISVDLYFSSLFLFKKDDFLSSQLLGSVSSTAVHALYLNVTAGFRSKVRALFE